jgi:hypothetical protein
MTPQARLFIIIFLIITTYMTAMSVVVRYVQTLSPMFIIAAFVLMGIVLSSLVIAVLKKTVKSVKEGGEEVVEEKPVEIKVDTTLVNAAQTLTLFQKKGRLIDFLQEDISIYDDSQIGSAVRNIHKGCQEVLKEHITIEPVLNEQDEASVVVEQGFDPSAIRLTGNVVGNPPFNGILRHCGWRVVSVSMPGTPKEQNLTVIEPAEVEIP